MYYGIVMPVLQQVTIKQAKLSDRRSRATMKSSDSSTIVFCWLGAQTSPGFFLDLYQAPIKFKQEVITWFKANEYTSANEVQTIWKNGETRTV
jgi:hypothetical protein